MVRGRASHARKGEAELLQILLEACRPWEKMPEALGEVHAGHSSSDGGFGCAFLEAWPWLTPSSRCACTVAWPTALQPRPFWGQPGGFCIRASTRLSYGETCACHPQHRHPQAPSHRLHVPGQGGADSSQEQGAGKAAICRPREISSGNGAGHSPQVTSPPPPPLPVPL